jgi:hypothetical protein
MPLCAGWHRAVWIFYVDYLGKMCVKPPDQDLMGGGGEGDLAPV